MPEPLLRVISLSKRHGGLSALDDISFELEPGEVLGLVGRHGAGKTSLLHAIGGVTPPTEGEILIRGQRVNLESPGCAREAGIELVHQTPHLAEQ